MKLLISPWRSSTPRAIARYLGLRLMKLDDVVSNHHSIILNWGCSHLRGAASHKLFNDPINVRMAANKYFTFRRLEQKDIPTLEFTKSREEAIVWNAKHSVICHSDVHGHSGSGLTRIEPKTQLNLIPFVEMYTKYFPKTREVRVLCIKNGASYDTMFLEKKRILPERYAEFGLDGRPDWFIRTHENGWIFAREADCIPGVVELAQCAMGHLALDFGAVDVLTKPDGDKWDSRVGEINTAPGLEGQTLEFFKKGLHRLIRQ